MSWSHFAVRLRWLVRLALVAGLAIAFADRGAQAQNFGNQSAVGGVSIDADGVLRRIDSADRERLRAERRAAVSPASRDLAQPTALRKISLARLEAAIREARKNGGTLSDEMRFLAGMLRVQYIFVYPDQRDIVLAGPGDGWTVGPSGDVVGLSSGRPVLLLDDLLVALRAARSGGESTISCSIDPTADGLAQLRKFAAAQKTIGDPATTLAQIEKSLGPQTITIKGVPAGSHMANVLVAADYRMKRLAMNLEESPVAGLPSFLELAKAGSAGMSSMLPRWWLAASYEPLSTDGEGLAWELRGQGVKAMAEEDFLSGGSIERGAGKASAAGQKWADNMTAKYDALAAKEPIFGELRNCMDLAVVAALIEREQLADKANCSLELLFDERDLPHAPLPAPKQVNSQGSLVKKGRKWLIGASGGVQIDAWSVAGRKSESKDVAPQAAEGTVARPTLVVELNDRPIASASGGATIGSR